MIPSRSRGANMSEHANHGTSCTNHRGPFLLSMFAGAVNLSNVEHALINVAQLVCTG